MSSTTDPSVEHTTLLADIASRNVVQLGEEDSLAQAVTCMAEKKISSIVVTDAQHRPSGIITEQNIMVALQSGRLSDSHLKNVMSTPIITVPLEMESHEAYMLCLRQGIRHLVLTDDQHRVAGVVSETDFRLHLNLTILSGRRPASSVMSRTVLFLPPEASLHDALTLMRNHRETCVVVVEADLPLGIITERDIVRLYHQDPDLTSQTLQEVMSSPVTSVDLDRPLNDVAQRMLEARLRHLVVVNQHGHLAGLITEHDLTQIMAFGLVDTRAQADRTFLRTLLDSIPDLVWLKDPNGVFLVCNSPCEKLFGVTEKEILGRTDLDFVDPSTADQYRESDHKAVIADRSCRSEEWLTFASDGYRRLFETIRTPVRDRHNNLIGVLGIARDISERKQAEVALTESRALLNAVVDSTTNPIWSVDAENFGLLTFNTGLRHYFQINHGIPLRPGMRPETLYPTDAAIRQWQAFYRRTLHEGSYSVEYVSCTGDVTLQLTFNRLYREDKVFGIAVFGEDITTRKASEARIQYLAYHDTLTNLPNRSLARERLNLAITYAARAQSRIALMLLDLDNFKSINDALGHEVGDTLLKVVSERLSSCTREADTVSRLGGDDFLILLTDIHDLDDVASIANKLINSIPLTANIDHHALSITASIGIAIYPDDAQDMDGLMKKADTALYVVKDTGRNDFRFFDEKFNAVAVEALAIKNELRLALERNEFVLHYQPQLDLDSGRLVGAEALVRWQSPKRGLVPPDQFIPVAEESGLIEQLGDWVLREACRQAAEWRLSGLCDDLTMAVNLSAVQFMRGDLEKSVVEALKQSGLEPQALELEMTESTLIRDPEQVLEIVHYIKRLGVSLSIDDFGTGFSSLSYLKRFPIDKLKIDRSFVRDMATNLEDAEIVRAIIQMARALGLKTIAEGIEDETTAQHLRLYHCNEGQGYHFAHPLTAKDFTAFVTSRNNHLPLQ